MYERKDFRNVETVWIIIQNYFNRKVLTRIQKIILKYRFQLG
jgi:hypothetical protein